MSRLFKEANNIFSHCNYEVFFVCAKILALKILLKVRFFVIFIEKVQKSITILDLYIFFALWVKRFLNF